MINILNGFKKDFVELLKVLTEQLIVILMKLLTTLTILLLRLEQLKMKYMKTVRKWQIRKIIHWLPTPLLIIPKSRLQSLYPIQARSEERRVGKECRTRSPTEHYKKQ